MKQNEPELLRVSKAAHELGLHPFTVRKWIKLGKIQAVWGRAGGPSTAE
jgi:putative resolvase